MPERGDKLVFLLNERREIDGLGPRSDPRERVMTRAPEKPRLCAVGSCSARSRC